MQNELMKHFLLICARVGIFSKCKICPNTATAVSLNSSFVLQIFVMNKRQKMKKILYCNIYISTSCSNFLGIQIFMHAIDRNENEPFQLIYVSIIFVVVRFSIELFSFSFHFFFFCFEKQKKRQNNRKFNFDFTFFVRYSWVFVPIRLLHYLVLHECET